MDSRPNFDSAMKELADLGVSQQIIATLNNLTVGETREVQPGITIKRGSENDGDSYTIES